MAALKAFLVVVVLSLSFVDAAVHPYGAEYFIASGDAYLFRGGREGLFASSSQAVLNWNTVAKGVANGKSYIRFDHLKFKRPYQLAAEHSPDEGVTGLVQAMVFELEDRNLIGYTAMNGNRHFCCSPELVSKTGCRLGHVIVTPHSGDEYWPHVVDIPFMGNETEVEAAPTEIKITKTGMYYLWYIICDQSLAGVTVHGATVWKNPAGYLPGMMMPFEGFYGFMSLAYIVLGLIWFAQYARNWRDILQLQNCITAVILLCMMEMATWYFDFVNFNSTGYRPYATTVWAVVLGAVRKTVSRMLILVVSMGYGVVRPTLGGLTSKVLMLGATYFVATCSLDIMQHVGTIDDLTSSARIFLVLPVAILDAVFILWIFTSLSKTLAQLQQRRQSAKLELYRKYTNALAICVVVSVAWIAYEMWFKVTDQLNERWQNDWITQAFWHLLNFVLLAVICYLWAPTHNGTRFAYSADAEDEYDEEEAASLTGGVALKTNPQDKAAAGSAGDKATSKGSSSKATKDSKPVNTDVFSLEDDELEEGKLE